MKCSRCGEEILSGQEIEVILTGFSWRKIVRTFHYDRCFEGFETEKDLRD